MASQHERRETTKSAILTAAAKIIDDRGFNDCSISAIAKETPYTTGAIQHHFKSKDELLYSIVTDHVFPMSSPTIDESILQVSLEQRCRIIIETMWSYYGHRNYSIVWQIILACKKNVKLRNEINQFFHAAEAETEAKIKIVFSDIPFTVNQIAELRQHLSAQLRGISLLRFTTDAKGETDSQLEYLIKLVGLKIREDANTLNSKSL